MFLSLNNNKLRLYSFLSSSDKYYVSSFTTSLYTGFFITLEYGFTNYTLFSVSFSLLLNSGDCLKLFIS